ncbi:MAG: hypothetical protein J6U87_00655, partial [Clostridia bacterium]|nr:hypothetical protein [Clostridia bacterium]
NSDDEASAGKDMRGLIAFKTHLHVVDFYNVLVEKHIVSLIPSGDNLDVTLDKCYFFNAWSTHIFAWNTNMVMDALGMRDVSPDEMAHYKPMTITIKDSTVAKCGGPVIASQAPGADYARNSKSGAIITAENCTIYSDITGEEVWFTTYGFAELAASLKTFNKPLQDTGKALTPSKSASFIKDTSGDTVGEFVNLIYVNQGPRGSFTVKDKGAIDPNEQTVAAYLAMISQLPQEQKPPLFQSSAGGIGFYNGVGIGTDLQGTLPSPTLFEGDYLSVFQGGMSIFVGYYH